MHHADPCEQERGRDWGAAARGLFLLAFATGVFALVFSGDIKLYIHPRFAPYSLMAAVLLVLMALAQFERFRAPGEDLPLLRWGRYAPFLVPLVLGLALPPATFGADLAAKQGVNLTARGRHGGPAAATAPAPADPAPAGSDTRPETAPVIPPAAGPPASTAGAPSTAASGAAPAGAIPEVIPPTVAAPPATARPEAAASPPPPAAADGQHRAPALVNGQVVLDDKTFAPWLLAIYGNQAAYVGKPVQMTGFVFRPEGLTPEQFVLARLIVTCHVAHAAPDGFLVAWPQAEQLQTDSWYRLEGVFEMGEYQGQDTLQIRVRTLTPVEKPADPYIYA